MNDPRQIQERTDRRPRRVRRRGLTWSLATLAAIAFAAAVTPSHAMAQEESGCHDIEVVSHEPQGPRQ